MLPVPLQMLPAHNDTHYMTACTFVSTRASCWIMFHSRGGLQISRMTLSCTTVVTGLSEGLVL